MPCRRGRNESLEPAETSGDNAEEEADSADV